jgi:opacity protein-like surface antigen
MTSTIRDLSRLTAISLLSLTAATAAFGQNRVGGTVRSAQTPADTTLIGARLGFVDVESLGDPVMSYGAFGDYALDNNFLVGGTLDYWNKSSGTIGDVSVQVSDLTLGANSKYIFTNVNVPFRPFALAGLAVHRFAVREGSVDEDGGIDKLDAKYKDIEAEFGLDFGGGAMYRLQRSLDVLAEIRYRTLTDSGVDLGQLAFSGGVSYLM